MLVFQTVSNIKYAIKNACDGVIENNRVRLV